jgi:hypothetical protein
MEENKVIVSNDTTVHIFKSDLHISKNNFDSKTQTIIFENNVDVDKIGWSISELPNLSKIVFTSQFQFDCFKQRYSDIKPFVSVPIIVCFEENKFVLSSFYDDNCRLNVWNEFSYILNNKNEIIIVKYDGKSSELEIPKLINGKKVIGIEAGTFKENDTIKRLMIDGIEIFDGDNYLGGAFEQSNICFASIKNINRIGRKTFYRSTIKELHLENIEFISNESFKECCKLEFITLSNSKNEIKTLIGKSTFYECNNLKEFNGLNNNNVCFIENYSFYNCFELQIGNLFEFCQNYEFDLNNIDDVDKNTEINIHKYFHCLNHIFGFEFHNNLAEDNQIINCSKTEYEHLKNELIKIEKNEENGKYNFDEELIHIEEENVDERFKRIYNKTEKEIKTIFEFDFSNIPNKAILSKISDKCVENVIIELKTYDENFPLPSLISMFSR